MASIPSERIANIFIIHFIYYFLFYANLLPSFIPRSLNLHNRQANDCVAGKEEVLLKGVVVDVEAEKMEEEAVDLSVGIVGKNNYEEPESCRSAKDFLLGEEMEGDSTGRMEVEAGAHPLKINDSNNSCCPYHNCHHHHCLCHHHRRRRC